MGKEWNAVEILRHSRHDWLNKLQLIKGNLALERLDRVNQIIEEILIETKNEAKLTNLKAEKLASLLMLFNWEEQHLSLEYEVIGDECNLSVYDDGMAAWCLGFFNHLNEVVKPFTENHLLVSIQLTAEDVRFIFDFRGIIEDERKLVAYLEKQRNHSTINILEYEVHNDEMIVTTQVLL